MFVGRFFMIVPAMALAGSWPAEIDPRRPHAADHRWPVRRRRAVILIIAVSRSSALALGRSSNTRDEPPTPVLEQLA